MLFKPSSANPYLTPVPATSNNTFSCYLNAEGGTQINKYNLSIKDLNGNSIYTTGSVALLPVLYNKNTLNITVPSTSGMINGIDYVWNIILYESNPDIWVTYGVVQSTSTTTNIYMRVHYNVVAGMYLKIGNESRLISTYSSTTGLAVVTTAFSTAPANGTQYNVYSNYVQSDDIYFKARALPVISISNFTSSVTNKAFTFNGSYSQSDNVNWKYYTFNLYDSGGELVDTTGEINTGVISYTFDGFITNTNYGVELVVETQDGIIVTTGIESFSVVYAVTTVFNNPVSTENLPEKNAIQISWGQPYLNASTVSGTYSYLSNTPDTGQTSVSLDYGSQLSYAIGTSLGSVLVPYNSTLSFRTRLPIGFQGNIVKLYNDVDGSYYSLSYTNRTFSFDINGLYTGTITIYAPTNAWLLGSTYTTTTNYIWDDTQTWDDTKYFYEQTVDSLNSNWLEFTLLPNAVLLTMIAVSDLTTRTDYTPVITMGSGSAPTGYYSLYLYGQQICDYAWICNKILTSTEVETTRGIHFEPSWNTNTMLMALFTNTLEAGSVGTIFENIINWSIYRKKVSSTRLYFVETLPLTTTNLIDYNVANQTDYIYYVFPITANTVVGALTSDTITTCWWNWSLTGILPTSTDGSYYADTDNIWLFKGNISSGSPEQNMDKTIYQGFTKYPKESVGDRNYLTGTISCSMGTIINSVYTTETVDMLERLLLFTKSGEEKILKNPKGTIRLVDTTKNSFSILDASGEQPVTVNFDWTEMGDLSEFSIVEQ